MARGVYRWAPDPDEICPPMATSTSASWPAAWASWTVSGVANSEDQRVLEIMLDERAQQAGGVAGGRRRRGCPWPSAITIGPGPAERVFGEGVVERDQVDEELLALAEDPVGVGPWPRAGP